MAATRLIPLHTIKGRNISQSLQERTDYAMNPEKTDNGEYITAYACDPRTVSNEFTLSQREYEHKTGRRQKNEVIAYQIRQSFKPGEVTPEEANRIGYETAMRFTKGNHAFIVATHTDRKHVHNHVIYNAINLSCDKKFRDFFMSGIALGRVSNLVCFENGLSVIAPKPYHSKTFFITAPRPASLRDSVREAIDIALSKKPKSFDALLNELQAQGYEIKRGKHTAVRGKNQKRFIRFRSLGKGYSEEDLRIKIEGVSRGAEPKDKVIPFYKDDSFDLLLNLQDIIAKGKGRGYEMWAKKYNLKNVMKAILFFQERGLRTYGELEEKAKGSAERFDELSDTIKDYEKRLKEITVLRQNIINYAKTKDTYARYRKSGYSKRFFEEHKEDILLHKAAKDAFNKHDGKLPSVNTLNEEFNKLLAQKRQAYSEYRQIRKDMQLYQTAKYDIDQILGITPTPEKKRTQEHSR